MLKTYVFVFVELSKLGKTLLFVAKLPKFYLFNCKPVLCLCPPESSSRNKTPLECPEDSDDVNPLSSSTSSRDESSKS